ncbi:AlpA family transcriptional regulator [Asticcacaulis sp.]|uniref:helix-turn-helix transcriptional regulator n=1 Tax=Asticcacaulis sp. TaxID=1872648 RepID=UPI0026316AE4|nr:AlpA family phage regulatory protein [Asticcacaulis sp.]
MVTSLEQRSIRRAIRRDELKQIVPLSYSTIYDMERKGEFPQRFYLTSRSPVWDLGEVETWLEARKEMSRSKKVKVVTPDVRLRKARPVRSAG